MADGADGTSSGAGPGPAAGRKGSKRTSAAAAEERAESLEAKNEGEASGAPGAGRRGNDDDGEGEATGPPARRTEDVEGSRLGTLEAEAPANGRDDEEEIQQPSPRRAAATATAAAATATGAAGATCAHNSSSRVASLSYVCTTPELLCRTDCANACKRPPSSDLHKMSHKRGNKTACTCQLEPSADPLILAADIIDGEALRRISDVLGSLLRVSAAGAALPAPKKGGAPDAGDRRLWGRLISARPEVRSTSLYSLAEASPERETWVLVVACPGAHRPSRTAAAL